MKIQTNVSLRDYTTMKIGGNARFLADLHSKDDVVSICQNCKKHKLSLFILGKGSNVIARDEGYNGVVARMHIPGFHVVAEDQTSILLRLGAGEDWDSVVKRTVDLNLSGIETMSAIPGTVGAAPVQNLGAYGQEISDVLQSIEAYDRHTNSFVTLQNKDCKFSYRHSIFRGDFMGRYIITSMIIKLSRENSKPPFYDSLQKYLDDNNIQDYSPQTIRNAVMEIRQNKLPNPEVLPNTGSFFKNAIVKTWQLKDLKAANPDMPIFSMADGNYKIPAGWLIEHAGLKGELINGMRVYDKNALVLVNESASSYNDLENARTAIINKVRDKFRIYIEQEPLEI